MTKQECIDNARNPEFMTLNQFEVENKIKEFLETPNHEVNALSGTDGYERSKQQNQLYIEYYLRLNDEDSAFDLAEDHHFDAMENEQFVKEGR